MRGQPDTDVCDEVRPARGSLFDDVQHVPAVHDREVSTLTDAVDEVGEERMAEPAQRLLPREPAGQLERGYAEPVAPRFGKVHDETPFLEHGEQVVDGRPRELEPCGDRRSSHRPTLGREMREDPERRIGRGDFGVGHACLSDVHNCGDCA